MGLYHLNFARPPAPSVSLPNNEKTRNPAAGLLPTLTSAKEANGSLVDLSHEGRSSTPTSVLKWLKKAQPRQSPCLSHHLATKYNHESGFSSRRREIFSQQHLNGRNGCTLSELAQKLANSSGHPESPKKHDGRLLNNRNPPYDDDRQLSSEGRKDSTMWCLGSSGGAYGKGKGYGGTIKASKGNHDGSGQSVDSGNQPERVPQAGGAGRWLYAAGGVGLSSAAVAAHASVGYGGGNGPQPPSRSGGGGGGGGGDNGGFEAGSSGESFFGDLIYGPGRKREEELSPPRATVKVRRRILDNRLPARTLASLSSAAGDFMDGEAPIGGGGRERGGRGERGGLSRGLEEAHQHVPNNQGSFSAAKSPFSDGMRDPPPESLSRNYNPPDPFFFVEDGGRGQDLPSNSASSSFEGSEGNANAEDMNRGRDVPFSPMGGERSSTGYNSTSNHFPSGKQQPQQYHNHKNYAQGNDFNKAPPRGDGYYGHTTTTSRGDSLHVPSEFSSIRGQISEIPGYLQDGKDDGKKWNDRHFKAPDFSRWLGGIVNSIAGKRTWGGAGSGTGGQSGDDIGKNELITEVTTRTLQMIKDQTTENGLAKSSETGALRRLQRESFSDLLKIRDRLDKLEHHTGARRGRPSGDDASTGGKTSMKGVVNAGGAYVLVDDLTTNLSRFAVQHAGLMTGLDVRFTFETPMRENDLLTTQCGVGQASGELDSSVLGGPISLQKINYVAQINEALSVAVAPLGAKASDMAETVNHLQGQALTTFAGSGPTMYQHCRGSAIGASLRNNSVMLSMSQFLSGWGNRALDTITSGPLCLSTLAQIMVQPCEHMVFSMSAVNNLWPCPPLPSSSSFHWSEMGPLVLCKTITRPTQPTGTFTFNDLMPSSSTASFLSQVHVPERDRWSPDAESALGSNGTSMQSVAFSGEVDLGGHVSIGGWAQLERADWLEELERKDFQWNVSLAKSSGPNVHWGLSLGRRKRDDWCEDGSMSPTSGPLDPSSQLQMEAFVKLKVGRGFSLQPGLVYIVDKDTQTPSFLLRSSWSL